MKLITEIPLRRSKISLTRADRILTLGSCFSDNMAAHLRDAGFDMLANPFGTLYNPESIESTVRRLDSCEAYTEADCVEMGAGAGRTCSFEHHTSFARKSAEEFLENANRRLEESRRFWKGCNRVLVTYGTARVWRHGGRTVSNCLKDPAVILADEATGNLDTRTSFEILVLFQKLHAEGRTIIFVTHNPDLAQYSSRNIRLRDGHVIEDKVNPEILSAAETLATLPKNDEDDS